MIFFLSFSKLEYFKIGMKWLSYYMSVLKTKERISYTKVDWINHSSSWYYINTDWYFLSFFWLFYWGTILTSLTTIIVFIIIIVLSVSTVVAFIAFVNFPFFLFFPKGGVHHKILRIELVACSRTSRRYWFHSIIEILEIITVPPNS